MAYLNKHYITKPKDKILSTCPCGVLFVQKSNATLCKPCRADKESIRHMMASRQKYE